MFKSYDIFWQDKVIFEYRRLLDRGDHMGRFDYKFNNNGDIHPSAHGVFMKLHSQDTATFKNLFSNPFNVMFINKKYV